MNGTVRAAWLCAGLAALAACRGRAGADSRASLARSVVSKWSPSSRLTADDLLQRYGPPDAAAPGALAWKDKGGWKRIVAWDAGAAGGDDLKETAAASIPASRRADIASFDRRVTVSADGREVTARSDDERLNYLAVNLAEGIARGTLSPVQARVAYANTLRLEASGKSSEATVRLLFPRPRP